MTMMASLSPLDGLGQIGENITENVQQDFLNSRDFRVSYVFITKLLQMLLFSGNYLWCWIILGRIYKCWFYFPYNCVSQETA